MIKWRKSTAVLLAASMMIGSSAAVLAENGKETEQAQMEETTGEEASEEPVKAEELATEEASGEKTETEELAEENAPEKNAEMEKPAAEEDTKAESEEIQVIQIELSDEEILVDGEPASEEEGTAVYLAHDIVYYEDRDTYDSGNAYGEGTSEDRHTAEEAGAHTVVHIAEAGTYRISGMLSAGQIAVDLGKESKTDPEAVVTLILDNVDITCTVAPAVIFYRVYECDEAWVAYDEAEEEEGVTYTASPETDLSAAGARVILADGSSNTVTGSHVARIYKDDESKKKKVKYDGAFYSCRSMTIDGEEEGTGVMTIIADNEGLNSELHLTINGGKVSIASQDDGINTNEDGVSVTTINGGELHIVAGLGAEGDGIDSNGYLVINGGVVISTAKPMSDSGLDSDMGSMINGGYVVSTGSTMDWPESRSKQVTMNLQFASSQAADEALIVTDTEGNVVFAYDPDKDETTGSYNRGYQGAVISCPEFEIGETYNLYVGGDLDGEETDGLYDASTVTGFEGAVRQQYTGTDVGFGGPGSGPMGGFGGGPGGRGWEGEPGERPAGSGEEGEPGERPAGSGEEGEPGERPAGSGEEGEPGERPAGSEEGGAPADQPAGFEPGEQGTISFRDASISELDEASIQFTMQDFVNAFSGIADEAKEQ